MANKENREAKKTKENIRKSETRSQRPPMPIGLRGLSVNTHMLAYEQAPRQPYRCFCSDRHYGALPATHKNTGLHPLQK